MKYLVLAATLGIVGCAPNDGWDVHLRTAHAYAIRDLQQGKTSAGELPGLDIEMKWLLEHNTSSMVMGERNAQIGDIQSCQITMLDQQVDWILAIITKSKPDFGEPLQRDVEKCVQDLSR